VIARLSGIVLDLRTDRLVLDVGGVGYDLAIPLGTFSALPPAGEKATVYVHTHVREDALQLFGFSTPQEKYVFERLISVSGIGPKVALTVLSGLPLPELIGAIVTQNARVLATIPGVGKKLAERLGLELKEKLSGFGTGAGAANAP
jgi:Holliday junction DNA helicase RuvA